MEFSFKMGMMNVSRYVNMTELKFEVEFITPTFLGGADGNAEIRTAPFKNLIRRWWRIVNGNLPSEKLLQRESEIFGSTEKNPLIVETNKNKKKSEREPEIFGKSNIQIKITKVVPTGNYISSEKIDIGSIVSEFGPMDLSKYLGYGAVGSKSYIKPKIKLSFLISLDSKYKDEIIDSLFLIHLFGSCGSRSRNGWGSVSIIPKDKTFEFNPTRVFNSFSDWKSVFNRNKNYPTRICKDEEGVLAWKTANFNSWDIAFEKIGLVYHDLILELKAKNPSARKLLGTAKGNNRLPAQVVVKICPQPVKHEGSIITKYYGLLIHIPYEIEKWNAAEQLKAGKYIHNYLDERKDLYGWQRNNGGASK